MLRDRVPLAPTPPEKLLDAQGRPYFLWDCDVTVAGLEAHLADPNVDVRAYWLGKLMRQAKPDDVFTFTTLEAIGAHWDLLERYLGDRRPFWKWWLGHWEAQGLVHR